MSLKPGPCTSTNIDFLKSTNCGNGLSICQWNVQCLTNSKFQEISASLNNVQHPRHRADIVILTETFSSNREPNTLFAISDYELYRRDRTGKKGGGIFIYVHNELMRGKRDDLMSSVSEILCLKVFPYKSKRPISVAVVYRLPSSKSQDEINIGNNIENAYLSNK